MNEIKILGVSQGAKEETFYGLSGIGDLITTCYSNLSRNYQFGVLISDGFTVNEAKAKVIQTIEGIPTANSAYNLGASRGAAGRRGRTPSPRDRPRSRRGRRRRRLCYGARRRRAANERGATRGGSRTT